jgi:hypothetical protein
MPRLSIPTNANTARRPKSPSSVSIRLFSTAA